MTGRGIEATIDGERYAVGGPTLLRDRRWRCRRMVPQFPDWRAASGLSPTSLRWPLPRALIISVLIRTCVLDIPCPVRRQGSSLPGLAVQQQ